MSEPTKDSAYARIMAKADADPNVKREVIDYGAVAGAYGSSREISVAVRPVQPNERKIS